MANQNGSIINGTEYGWIDVQVVIVGKTTPVEGITAFEYGSKQEKVNIYGRGKHPVSRGRGKVESNGKVTLLQSEFEALVLAVTGEKDPLAIPPFAMTVSYAPEGGKITTDKLYACEFTEWKKGMKTGDPNQEIELPMIIGRIKQGVQ
jgi:hypothetical protein